MAIISTKPVKTTFNGNDKLVLIDSEDGNKVKLIETSKFKGEKGEDGLNGTNGTNGTNGKSAYQVWLDAGNTGTVNQFLASLIGADGNDGDDGIDGDSAYQIWLDAGNIGNITAFLNSLKGAKGDNGTNGVDGKTFEYRGVYDSGTSYDKGFVVFYGGDSFVSLIDINTSNPSDITKWGKIASKGADGIGSGDMLVSIYDPAGGARQVAFANEVELLVNKSIDISLDGDSNIKYPSVKAVKDYTDGLVLGALNYRGGYDASGGTYPTTGGSGTGGAIRKGNMFIISVAGTLGGQNVQIGDAIIANINTPGQTSTNWNTLNSNISYVPEDISNKSTSTSLGVSNTLYPTQNAVKVYVDTLDAQNVKITGSQNIAGVKNLSSTLVVSGRSNPSSGTGLELNYDNGTGRSNIISYNRTGSSYIGLGINDFFYISSGGSAGQLGIGKAPTAGYTVDLLNSQTTGRGFMLQSSTLTTGYNFFSFVSSAHSGNNGMFQTDNISATGTTLSILSNGTTGSRSLYVRNTGSGSAIIVDGGNVIIGTTTDDATNKLQVTGNISITGSGYFSTNLTGGNGKVTLRDGCIENNTTNADADLAINYYGYNISTTRFRNLPIYDGKTNLIGKFVGSTRNLLIGNVNDVGSRVLIVNGTDAVLGATTGTLNTQLHISQTNGANGTGAGISFGVSSSVAQSVGGKIVFIRSGTDSQGHLAFFTKGASSTNYDTTTEKARITDVGNLLLGTTTDSGFAFDNQKGDFRVKDNSKYILHSGSSNAYYTQLYTGSLGDFSGNTFLFNMATPASGGIAGYAFYNTDPIRLFSIDARDGTLRSKGNLIFDSGANVQIPIGVNKYIFDVSGTQARIRTDAGTNSLWIGGFSAGITLNNATSVIGDLSTTGAFKFENNGSNTTLFYKGATSPNSHFHFFSDFVKTSLAIDVGVKFGYNAEIQDYHFYSKWGGTNVVLGAFQYTSTVNQTASIKLGNYYLWCDSSGKLRIKSSAPTSDTDGTVVGTQS